MRMKKVFCPGVKPDFGYICVGDCMQPTVNDGDIVLIHRQETFTDGQIVAVRVQGVELLKRAYKLSVGIFFTMDNRRYTPFVCDPKDVEVLGIAVGLS